MYAQLGNITFDKLAGFTDFDTADEAYYAEHSLIGRKALLQPTGQALKTGTIKVSLRQDFTDVAGAIALLYGMMQDYTAGNLIWGTGDVEGMFVITNITNTYTQQLPDGTLVACDLSITLKEFVGDLTQARKDAPAVNKPENKKAIANKPSCNTKIAAYWRKINAAYNDIQRLSTDSAYDKLYVKCKGQDAMTAIDIDLDTIDKNARLIFSETQTPGSCAYGDQTIINAVNALLVKIQPFKDFIHANFTSETDPLPQIKILANNLGDYIAQLKQALTNYINGSITRK